MTCRVINCAFLPGEKVSVGDNNGEFDFRQPRLLGEALSKCTGKGFDHTFCKNHESNFCARLLYNTLLVYFSFILSVLGTSRYLKDEPLHSLILIYVSSFYFILDYAISSSPEITF